MVKPSPSDKLAKWLTILTATPMLIGYILKGINFLKGYNLMEFMNNPWVNLALGLLTAVCLVSAIYSLKAKKTPEVSTVRARSKDSGRDVFIKRAHEITGQYNAMKDTITEVLKEYEQSDKRDKPH